MVKTILGATVLGLAITMPMAASAQVPFKVARPQDGARVRETVRIQIPRTALTNVKYLALSVDGKFRAGLGVPSPVFEKNGKAKSITTDVLAYDETSVSILWNTKTLTPDPKNPSLLEGVEDGPHAVEIIAFDGNNKRIGRQSLTLEVDNKGGLRVPADGILLTYRFQVGDETHYSQKTDVEYLGENKPVAAGAGFASGSNGFASQGRGMSGGGGGFAGGGMNGDGDMGKGGPGMSSSGPRGGMGSSGPRGGSGMMGGGGGPRGGMGSSGPRGMGSSGPRGGAGMMGGGMMGGGMMGGGMMGGAGGAAFGRDNGNFQASGPFTLPVQTVTAKYERSTEDRVTQSAYFTRDLVTEGTITAGNGASARLEDVFSFKSRYRTLSTSGKTLEYGVASADRPGAYVALPVIDLGGQKVRVGQPWQSRTPVLLEWATLDAPPTVVANNVLESLEWQDGYQTARIKQTFEGRVSMPIYGGAAKMDGAKVKMTRMIWFGFKAGKVVRTETTVEVDGDAPASVIASMVPGAGVSGGAGLMGGMGGMGGGMMGGGKSAGGMGGGDEDMPSMGGSGFGSGMGSFGNAFGMQGETQAESKVPAKFKSFTVVTLDKPAAAPTKTVKK
jgi:hypothetical protein